MKFANGYKSLGQCARCGFRYRLNSLRQDGRNPALLVCWSCYDIKPPAERPQNLEDSEILRRPAPDLDNDSVGGSKYGYCPGSSGNYFSTPDSASVSITGDIDIRVQLSLDDWTPSAESCVLSKWGAAGNRSYRLNIQTSGIPKFYWTADGTTVLSMAATTAVVAIDGKKKWLCFTLDVDNGASGRTGTFYVSENGWVWQTLGSAVTDAGTTSLYDSTATLTLSGITSGTDEHLAGKVFYADVRSSIGGSAVAKFDPSEDAAISGTSFTADTGEVWTVNTSGSTVSAIKGESLVDLLGTQFGVTV